MDRPPDFDDDAYRLVGQIIAAWSDIHEHVHGQIGLMQTRIYVLQRRFWMSANPGGDWSRNHGRERMIPDSKFRRRLSYFRRLAKIMAQGDEAVCKRLDTVSQKIGDLYRVRNDFAHSRIQMGSVWDEPSISLSSHGWMDDWHRKSEGKLGFPVRPPKSQKTMLLAEMETHLSDMRNALRELREIPIPYGSEDSPPEQPQKPS